MLVIKDGKEAGEASRCFITHLSLGGIYEIRVLVATEKGIKWDESLKTFTQEESGNEEARYRSVTDVWD